MTQILSGFCIGGAILWAWMMWRVLFESANIHDAPDVIRRVAWKPFRWFIVCMGSSIVFFLAPREILYASHHIMRDTADMIGVFGTFFLMVAAIFVHHGLDIAVERKAHAISTYVVIVALSITYSLTRGWL